MIYLMVTVTDRNFTKKFSSFYSEFNLNVSTVTAGTGTAASEILDYLGLGGSEKSVLFHVVTDEKWLLVKKALQTKIKIDMPGTGIVFLIPMSSIGGKKALRYLLSGQEFNIEEESQLKDTKYELLVIIANQGYTETVMSAARKAKASGGTIIHAKGTGTHEAEKFMGVTLVPEKEMVFIVVKTERKNAVMKSVMDEAGLETKAGAVCFSLPVTDTAGMRLMEFTEDEEEA